VSTDEVPNATFAYTVLQVTESVLGEGAIAEARVNYQTTFDLLRDWLFALVSDETSVRERALQQSVPAEIDRVYLATEPLMGLFRTARYQQDLQSASQAGEFAVQLFGWIGWDSLRAADCIGEVGAFLVEQDDPEAREYGQGCIEQAEHIREFVRLRTLEVQE
jgi:hypothetical protein